MRRPGKTTFRIISNLSYDAEAGICSTGCVFIWFILFQVPDDALERYSDWLNVRDHVPIIDFFLDSAQITVDHYDKCERGDYDRDDDYDDYYDFYDENYDYYLNYDLFGHNSHRNDRF